LVVVTPRAALETRAVLHRARGNHQAARGTKPSRVCSPRFVAEGGFVTGTESLGGMALVFRIELTSRALEGLSERLVAAGARLSEASRAQLERERTASDPDREIVGSLLLRFYASEPDLKLDIPKVPG
jgi:hypothetical protein